MKTLKEFFTGKSNNVTDELTFQKSGIKVAENQTLYQCPMKCEGDRMYKEPGNCPECNMKLVLVNNKSSHDHHKHNHGCC